MKFEGLKFGEMRGYDPYTTSDGKTYDPIQSVVMLPNGLEVSIVKHGESAGSILDAFEMSAYRYGTVIEPPYWDGRESKGWLRPEDVEEELKYLASLEVEKHFI